VALVLQYLQVLRVSSGTLIKKKKTQKRSFQKEKKKKLRAAPGFEPAGSAPNPQKISTASSFAKL
tara:strand:- start:246 stop:440 length:195 start_codon:yes stop_codon:yes gene_type:complete